MVFFHFLIFFSLFFILPLQQKHDKEDKGDEDDDSGGPGIASAGGDDERTESSVAYNDQPAHYSHQEMHKLHHEEGAPRAERLTSAGDRPPQFSTEPT